MASIDPSLVYADAPPEVPLETLDTTTLRALCDGGWLDHATYLGIARARGVTLAEPVSPPPAAEDTAPRPSGLEDSILITVPAGAPLNDVKFAIDRVGGRISGHLDGGRRHLALYPVRIALDGAHLASAVSTAMQHQPKPELPQAMQA